MHTDPDQLFWKSPQRTSLESVTGIGLRVVRPCTFSFPGKILTPVDDLLVPLISETALKDIKGREGIAGVITTAALAPLVPNTLGLALADDPMRAHHEVHATLAAIPGRLWRDFPSKIHPSATVHPTAWIPPMNVSIGENVSIGPGVVVQERSVIGASTRIHANVVIGADAYEVIIIDGDQYLRPQTGGVLIEEYCEVLAGAIVTRSAFCGATVIERRSVLDCNVVISHDCRVRANVRIGGSSWIGGRVVIGNRAALGPNCTIGNGLEIGAEAKISLGAVVTRDVADKAHVSGNFAIDHDRLIEHVRQIR